jgi:hypothetical protein
VSILAMSLYTSLSLMFRLQSLSPEP